MSKVYDKKLIVSGNVLELYEYEMPVVKSDKPNRIGRSGQYSTSDETKRQNRAKTAMRARGKVRRFANANFSNFSKFVTLTFADNVTNLKDANSEFERFMKRFKRYIGYSPQYIAVVEFQKRGAVHFHMLMNCPYIENSDLARIWGKGYVKINAIDNVDNIGAYITKYMTKDNLDDRLIGQKSYFMSRNLKQPEETINPDLIDYVLAYTEVKRVACSNSFDSEYYGTIHYTQVILEKPISLSEHRRLFHLRRAGATIEEYDSAVKQIRRQGLRPCPTTI